jgi:hypothetical protein
MSPCWGRSVDSTGLDIAHAACCLAPSRACAPHLHVGTGTAAPFRTTSDVHCVSSPTVPPGFCAVLSATVAVSAATLSSGTTEFVTAPSACIRRRCLWPRCRPTTVGTSAPASRTPAGDGSAWCRLAHAVICPARDADTVVVPALTSLRRVLALNTRRLTDAGGFTPGASTVHSVQQPAESCRPARPVVQLLYVRYLGARPLDEIQCVAQTRQRDRCTHRMLASDGPAGVWRLVPATATRGQLALPSEVMALYDLSPLPYAEQLRWRTQRCPQHAAALRAGDLALTDWEPFDPLAHHAHVHPRLPTHVRRPDPGGHARKATRR